MNNIHEKRESIITDNNSAQDELNNNILENLHKNVPSLWITKTLHGDLDFSVLEEKGFSDIKEIFIKKGEVTSIRKIPERIRYLECIDNYLTEISGLPHSLVELNLDFNYLEYIDLKRNPNIRKLVLSHNKLTQIDNLPPSLEELYLNYNQIQKLDLRHLTKLRILHIKNNPSVIIEHSPKSLVDLQLDNDPFQTTQLVDEVFLDENEEKDSEENDQEENKIEYRTALNEYFKLKHKYESGLFSAKKIAFEQGKTKREKNRLIQQIQPKCIHCKRPVGTIFSKKNNKYIAICGDKVNPCKLNIKLFTGLSMNFNDILYLYKESTDKIKETIICQKLNTIFNYIGETESTEIFKKNITEYYFEKEYFDELLEKYRGLTHDTIKHEIIQNKINDIYRIVAGINELLNEYHKTNNGEILKRIAEIESQELIPETHNLRMLKYKIMEIYFIEENNILFQKENALGDLDHYIGELPRVVRFRR